MIIGGRKLRVELFDHPDPGYDQYYIVKIIHQDDKFIARGTFEWISNDRTFMIRSAGSPQLGISFDFKNIRYFTFYIRGICKERDGKIFNLEKHHFKKFKEAMEEFNRDRAFTITVVGE